ncbi:Uncharacterised protein [Streptococcus acidominimus]|uniref:Uncharacterized protein n=1 Tax=Streptococcus acidominimus TaxID=1326 RepID=A0A380IHN0_STRAI|nr:Uncharacterised protein [Streptococcus acidominimus]
MDFFLNGNSSLLCLDVEHARRVNEAMNTHYAIIKMD